MKKMNKLLAGVVLGSVVSSSAFASSLIYPTFRKSSTFGVQVKSVSFDKKLGLDDSAVYGLYYGMNWDFGERAAWGMKLSFELDGASMKDSDGKSFIYMDYYALMAPSYTFVFGKSNLSIYGGAKFGYNKFENTNGYAYGYVVGVEYDYKALNIGANYFSGTTVISGFDFDISEIGGYIGYNF
jgi:hypothetical protein